MAISGTLSSDCMRIGAIRLCLAMMLGLLVVSGYVVAPILFTHADSAMQAGMLAGHIFHVVNIGVLFLAAAIAAFWMRLEGIGRLNWLLLLFIMVLLASNEFVISPLIQDIKDSVGAIDSLAKDDPQRVQFGIYHGVSAVCHLLASCMAALLVALGGKVCKKNKNKHE